MPLHYLYTECFHIHNIDKLTVLMIFHAVDSSEGTMLNKTEY
jgi:hypothetical protein